VRAAHRRATRGSGAGDVCASKLRHPDAGQSQRAAECWGAPWRRNPCARVTAHTCSYRHLYDGLAHPPSPGHPDVPATRAQNLKFRRESRASIEEEQRTQTVRKPSFWRAREGMQSAAAFEGRVSRPRSKGCRSAIKSGEVTCNGSVYEVLTWRAPRLTTVSCTALINGRWRKRQKSVKGYVRAGKTAGLPDEDRQGLDGLSRPRAIQGLAARVRPHGKAISDPSVWQQQGMRVGIPRSARSTRSRR
jgi:hypothetical protein